MTSHWILLLLLTFGDGPESAPASAPAATVVRLQPRAVVRGSELTLSDFAELTGPRAAELANVAMGYAPSPGRERNVLAESVAQRLTSLGLDKSAFKIFGKQSNIRVSTQLIPAAELGKRVMDLTRTKLPAGAALEIRGALADWILPEARELGTATELVISGDVNSIRGDGSVDVRALCGTELLGSLLVPVRVKFTAEVLVALASLQRGDLADVSRFEKKKMDVTHMTGDTVNDASSLTGRILARPIAKDAILTAADLARAPLFRKGDQTRLVIRRGALRIEALVRVDGDATAGGSVQVTCLEFGKSLIARVKDDGTLTLDSEETK